jgi:large subunit ribosomal protein L9
MKVILTQDVRAQGKKGQLINVSDGYATNYLLPKGLAVMADARALNDIKNKEAARLHRLEEEKAAAKEIAGKLDSLLPKLKAQAGSDGKLYGSVTTSDLADALKEQYGVEIDKRKISFDEPVKSFGTHTASAKLFPEITGKIHFLVTDDKN